MAWIDDIKARIGLYVGSQGNQAGLSGLAELLNDIADKANEGGGGGDSELIVLNFGDITSSPVEITASTKEEFAEALGITTEQVDSIMKGQAASIGVRGDGVTGAILFPLRDSDIGDIDHPEEQGWQLRYGEETSDAFYRVGIEINCSEGVWDFFAEYQNG